MGIDNTEGSMVRKMRYMNIPKTATMAIIIMLIGILFTILAIANSDITLAIAGLAFILSGFIQFGQVRDSEQNKKRFEQIMNKLDKIEQKLEKVEQPKGTSVVIADVISSGLKYYTEHVTKPKKEEEND